MVSSQERHASAHNCSATASSEMGAESAPPPSVGTLSFADTSGVEDANARETGHDNISPLSRLPSQASFAQLAQHRRLLFLQGPNGPFFARLRDYLTAAGRYVVKINFNGGDDLFYRKGDIVRFTMPMVHWESFLRGILAERHIDAIVLFGCARRQHRIAARVAEALSIKVWVFEEGYVRPDYITLEAGGVNADSPLAPLTLSEIPRLERPAKPRHFRHPFRWMAWHSFCYFAAGILGARKYPEYRHHKPFGLHEFGLWCRAGWRKWAYRWQQRELRRQLLASDHPHFFMVALQVYNDSQIRFHSPWRRIEDFIEWTIHSFAYNAPRDTMLVIKHHPMDRGHTNYAAAIEQCAQRFGVVGRVAYLHDIHLPSLLHRCDGVVTINSTTGLQAMYHRVPVIALGRCFYAKEGLTYQGSLDNFWNDPKPVDIAAYRKFRNYLIHASQINSSFYADTCLDSAGTPKVSRKRWTVRVCSAFGLIAFDALLRGKVNLSWLTLTIRHAKIWLAG